MSGCRWIYDGRNGGRRGQVCGRPEEEHCPATYGANPETGGFEDHADDCGRRRMVHHPFHRPSGLRRIAKQCGGLEVRAGGQVAKFDGDGKLMELVKAESEALLRRRGLPTDRPHQFEHTFPLRLKVLANGSHMHHYTAAKFRRQEREAVAYELRAAGIRTWRRDHAGPYRVELWRFSPGTLDEGNLWYALKGVQDQVAEELGLASDRDGQGATWSVHQEKTRRNDRDAYRVRVVVRPEAD